MGIFVRFSLRVDGISSLNVDLIEKFNEARSGMQLENIYTNYNYFQFCNVVLGQYIKTKLHQFCFLFTFLELQSMEDPSLLTFVKPKYILPLWV